MPANFHNCTSGPGGYLGSGVDGPRGPKTAFLLLYIYRTFVVLEGNIKLFL
jgi:hypothetical protein